MFSFSLYKVFGTRYRGQCFFPLTNFVVFSTRKLGFFNFFPTEKFNLICYILLLGEKNHQMFLYQKKKKNCFWPKKKLIETYYSLSY
jgi:hypothetical protein